VCSGHRCSLRRRGCQSLACILGSHVACSCSNVLARSPCSTVPVREQLNHFPDSLHAEQSQGTKLATTWSSKHSRETRNNMKTASPAVRARSTQKQSIFLVRCRPAFCSLKLGKHGERHAMQCAALDCSAAIHFSVSPSYFPREQSSFLSFRSPHWTAVHRNVAS
jgi:hypothetical protein